MRAVTRLDDLLQAPPEHLALLDAIHAAPDDFDDALRRWHSIVRDRADANSNILIPLLTPRLADRRDDLQLLVDHCRTITRIAHAKNVMLRRRRAQALLPLLNENISPILIKGAALQRYYPAGSLRPYGDIDLVVPFADLHRAIAIYLDAGWQSPSFAHPRRFDPRFAHAIELRSPDGDVVDLHGHPMHHWITWAKGAELFQRGAVPFETDDDGVRTLCVEHHLIHTVVNAIATPTPQGRWIADLLALIAAGPIDWQRVVADAGTIGVAPLVGHALTRLRRFGTCVAPDVIERLAASPVTPALFAFNASLYGGRIGSRLRGHWHSLRAGAVRGDPAAAVAIGYLRFCLARRGPIGRSTDD